MMDAIAPFEAGRGAETSKAGGTTTAEGAGGSANAAKSRPSGGGTMGGVIRNANNAKSPVNVYVMTRAVPTFNPFVSE
jgi:hypothetical protein